MATMTSDDFRLFDEAMNECRRNGDALRLEALMQQLEKYRGTGTPRRRDIADWFKDEADSYLCALDDGRIVTLDLGWPIAGTTRLAGDLNIVDEAGWDDMARELFREEE